MAVKGNNHAVVVTGFFHPSELNSLIITHRFHQVFIPVEELCIQPLLTVGPQRLVCGAEPHEMNGTGGSMCCCGELVGVELCVKLSPG